MPLTPRPTTTRVLLVFYPKEEKEVATFTSSVLSYPCPGSIPGIGGATGAGLSATQLLLLIMLKQMRHFVMQNVLLLLGPRYLLQSCLPIHL